MTVTLLGYRTYWADVIRLSRGQWIRVDPNPIGLLSLEEEGSLYRERHTQGGRPGEDRGREWRDAASARECQGLLATRPTPSRRFRKDSSLEPSEGM